MQTEKLTLAQLSGYLAYGLRVKEGNSTYTMSGSFLDDWLNYPVLQNDFKPLVIPLDRLTEAQWIEVFKAGISAFKDVESDYYVYGSNRYVTIEYKQWATHIKVSYGIKYHEFTLRGYTTFNQLSAFAKLHELHADLHGWIEKGLGINKLEIK